MWLRGQNTGNSNDDGNTFLKCLALTFVALGINKYYNLNPPLNNVYI